ncbi:protein tipE isoform X2 [Scaptodrosophila lebanonensis]|uniref:Protein tipE isoform X2 n=1 Tax=Drosophila lebanonensis TaxID=7225 RepID=A0A6J2TW39_DROLE|nr:protein tipE isoform X2 [Scaptodrosophila lebanonensis]
MKKSSTLTTTTSMPTSPTLSAQTLSASRISLSSSKSGKSFQSQNGPVRPGSGCVSAINAKREEIEIDTILEKAKFYTSVCLGSTAILSVLTFLFLIPFVVDPAISTIIADYDPVPVTCIVIDHIYAEGIKNCSWSSCREGCTSSLTKCHQLFVNYTRIPYSEWERSPRDLDTVNWDVSYTKFLINSEGCGYPPTTNCSVFARQYGFTHVGEPFPCYYSRAYPEVVIGRYSWENNLYHLVLSLIIPNVLFAISIGVLSYWYCPCCEKWNKSSRVYAEKFPTKEDKLLCHSDEDDEMEY